VSSIVTLTTDFEEREPYAASAKGVLYSRCPGVQIIDLTHYIPRENVPEGALFIAGAIPYFPKGIIHLVAVASEGRPIVVSLGGQRVVCSDNGVVTMLAERFPIEEAHVISNPDLLPHVDGQTYFGRDVFAPAAALLASGAPLQEVGEAIDDVSQLDLPRPEKEDKSTVSGRVIHVNRFGTLVTNIHESFLEGLKVKSVEVGTFNVGGLSKTYADVEHGYPLALYGSAGYLEVAYHGDSAEARLGLGVGIIVMIAVESA